MTDDAESPTWFYCPHCNIEFAEQTRAKEIGAVEVAKQPKRATLTRGKSA